jgi:hypothetical protein
LVAARNDRCDPACGGRWIFHWPSRFSPARLALSSWLAANAGGSCNRTARRATLARHSLALCRGAETVSRHLTNAGAAKPRAKCRVSDTLAARPGRSPCRAIPPAKVVPARLPRAMLAATRSNQGSHREASEARAGRSLAGAGGHQRPLAAEGRRPLASRPPNPGPAVGATPPHEKAHQAIGRERRQTDCAGRRAAANSAGREAGTSRPRAAPQPLGPRGEARAAPEQSGAGEGVGKMFMPGPASCRSRSRRSKCPRLGRSRAVSAAGAIPPHSLRASIRLWQSGPADGEQGPGYKAPKPRGGGPRISGRGAPTVRKVQP